MKTTKLHTLNVLILMLILASGVLGQSTKKIFGYVFDSKSSLPLVGANILIEGTGIGTSTNQFGYFQFDNLYTGTYSITTSYIGYNSSSTNTIAVYLDQPTNVTIYMEPAENKLNDVVVAGIKSNNYKNLKLYTSEDIAKNNYQTVADVLVQTSGVEIQSKGGAGSSQKVSIRGSETNQVLVLLDGIPLNNQFGGGADLSKIPTNIIEKIEIYEGGSSSKFGSGAIGGVINITTKRIFKNELKLNVAGGSFGFYNVEPSISGNINNLSYFISYNLLHSIGAYNYNYLNTKGEGATTTRLNADIKSQNVFARVNYKLNNYLFSVNAQVLDSDRGLPGKTNALTPYARSHNINNIFGSSIKATFKDVVIDFNGSYSQSKTDNSNLYPTEAPPEHKRYSRYHYKYESDITILNSTIYYEPVDWLNITTGYNGKWLQYNDENFITTLNAQTSSASDISHGFFMHQEYKVNLSKPFSKFAVSPSIRYDEMRMSSGNLNRFENQWSPSISAYISVGNNYKIFLKSSISKSFRVPTFSDLFYQDVRIEGKPDLLPEKSLNKEIGVGWEVNRWGKLRGEITLYNYSIEDMIVWKLGSFEIFRPFNNDADITGQEYLLSYQLPKQNIGLQVSYTYLQPLDKNNQETTHNKIIPYRPQHSFKSSLHMGYKEFSANINYRFVGKRFVTVANTVELSPYNVLDIVLLQNIVFENFNTTIKLSANNIFNEKYEIVLGYPIPGREFRLGLTLTY